MFKIDEDPWFYSFDTYFLSFGTVAMLMASLIMQVLFKEFYYLY